MYGGWDGPGNYPSGRSFGFCLSRLPFWLPSGRVFILGRGFCSLPAFLRSLRFHGVGGLRAFPRQRPFGSLLLFLAALGTSTVYDPLRSGWIRPSHLLRDSSLFLGGSARLCADGGAARLCAAWRVWLVPRPSCLSLLG